MTSFTLFIGGVAAALLLRPVLGLIYAVIVAYAGGGKTLKSLGATPGSWAIVTGGSDGIGKEFATQIAQKHGLNVLLVARNKEKLDTVQRELSNSAKGDIKTHVLDFSKATPSDYARLKETILGLPGGVSVLINNVAVNHVSPVSFIDESIETIESIVQVNISAQLAVTRIIAPLLVSQKKGLILNIGSLAGIVPSGYLSVYSASKAFLRFWSNALAMELKPSNVHVEHIRAFFIVTAMSKIRKPTWLSPTPKAFVKAVLGRLGKNIDSAPYPSHAILMWAIDNIMGERFWIDQSNNMHIDIMKRVVKKKEREAAAAAGSRKKDI
ncbi:hypothetical protein HK100_001466 [Physocladia obscura]|uniref:Very-long-chain 3-oxoacyl-CoA reductase n=1 Tax=Physocladia obscura TaxID=109957 RepID=A0AAD5XEU9_9FUNG|nr:hypothetical protein HK100_001466 [Physocladia obscura]